MTIGSGLTLAGIVIAISAALGFAVAYVRANLAKNTIDLYRADNDALRARVKTQDEELAEKDKSLAEQKVSLIEKDAQIKHITDIATGATAIEALRKVEEREHKALLDAFNSLHEAIRTAVRGRKADPNG